MKITLLTFTTFLFGATLFAQDTPDTEDNSDNGILMYSIYFGGGSYYVDDDQEQGLYDFLDAIPNIENYAISVHSYTDDIGGVDYNNWLSAMRSDAVIELLLNQAIERDRISIQDFGELNPVYDNSTWEGKLKNRRADVILVPLLL
jgi:outer membrane protein OmpA-like peptidoglycan-associated protein